MHVAHIREYYRHLWRATGTTVTPGAHEAMLDLLD
jgi:hypothetical protein